MGERHRTHGPRMGPVSPGDVARVGRGEGRTWRGSHPATVSRGVDGTGDGQGRPRDAIATARRAATPALLTMSDVFARTERPSVSSATRANSHGVRAGPWTPARPASAIASSTAPRASVSERASAAGTGTQTRIPDPRPRSRWVATTPAAAATSATDAGATTPLVWL